MIELLILYKLSNKVLTMYGISKDIRDDFSVLTTPSYGTIKPALVRLERSGFLKKQKTMSAGGRPSVYYSITENGKTELKNLMLSPVQENPIQFLSTARVRLACAEILEQKEQIELFRLLKLKSENIIAETKLIITNKERDFYSKMVLDNLICEYNNLVSLLEGFARACKN